MSDEQRVLVFDELPPSRAHGDGKQLTPAAWRARLGAAIDNPGKWVGVLRLDGAKKRCASGYAAAWRKAARRHVPGTWLFASRVLDGTVWVLACHTPEPPASPETGRTDA